MEPFPSAATALTMNSTTNADGGTRLSFPRIAHPVHASALSPSSPKRTEPEKVPHFQSFFDSVHGTMLPASAGARRHWPGYNGSVGAVVGPTEECDDTTVGPPGNPVHRELGRDDPRFATALHIADTPLLRNRLLKAMSSSFRMRNRALRARRARAVVVASRTLLILAGG